MGLVIFGVMALYLIVSIIVVVVAVRAAKKRGKTPWHWGAGAALVMYLIPFWDWIPTVVAHKYYCSTEAGFWVYKTVDQWKTENPKVIETLHQSLLPSQKTSYGDKDVLDERFAIETHRRQPILLITTEIAERRLVDTKTGEMLAKGTDVGSGVGYIATGGGFKFWLNQDPCMANDFWKLVKQLGQMRGMK